MWLALIKHYWNVSLLREKPENTPYSPLLSCIVGFIFLVLIVVQWMTTDVNQKLEFGSALLIAGSLILSYILYTWVLLVLFRLKSRVLQTLTCLFATHTIVHLAAFPLLLIMPLLLGVQATSIINSFIGIVYLVFTLMLAIWQFMVSAYIYKQALTVSWFPATLASLGLLACNILTISLW